MLKAKTRAVKPIPEHGANNVPINSVKPEWRSGIVSNHW